MSVLDPNGSEKSDSAQANSSEPGSVQSGQTFQVREGDRIVIDKKKFYPTLTRYKRRTIISIREK
jgi:hypothetical protein